MSAGTSFESLSILVTTTLSAGLSSSPITVPAASLDNASRRAPLPSQTHHHRTSIPTAVGFGIGIPLGAATIGLLGFLFWKNAMRQRRDSLRTPDQNPVLAPGGQFAAAAIDGRWIDLPEAQSPRELDGQGRTELPSLYPAERHGSF